MNETFNRTGENMSIFTLCVGSGKILAGIDAISIHGVFASSQHS